MRPAKAPEIHDDLNFTGIQQALEDTLTVLTTKPDDAILRFGEKTILVREYSLHLKQLAQSLQTDPSGGEFLKQIKANYEFLEVYGQDDWGDVFVTSYYEPVIKAARAPTKLLPQPLYSTPKDMVFVDLERYAEVNDEIKNWIQRPIEQKSSHAQLRGRVVHSAEATRIVPYYSRKEIDVDGTLKKKNLELAWVDPIDSFFLQIQGSGILKFDDGKQLHVGYESQNGHPYYAIGKSLYDVIDREKMSMKSIETYLRSISQSEMQNILNENASYVFFKVLTKDARAVTYMGTGVTPGRTIATDYRIFPKGGLAFLQFEKPIFETDADQPTRWIKASRFVVDQDTGGAIRGPHRLDLYWGQGKQAARAAGVMKNPGRLYYLFPKKKTGN